MKERRGKEVEKSHRDGTLNYVFLYISITTAIIYTEKNGGLDKGGQYIFNSASVEFYVTRLTYKKEQNIVIFCYDKGYAIFSFYVI